MVRRRIKHKEVLETIQQDDIEVAREGIRNFWNKYIAANSGVITTVLVIVVGGFVLYTVLGNKKDARLTDANDYLAEAAANYNAGDMVSALSELNQILPGGKYSDKSISIAAEMLHATIAYASQDYETSISILNDLIPEAPETLKGDLLYQLAAAQESQGDPETALTTLEEIVPFLGAEPESGNPDRPSSVWDRYYFRKGRALSRSGNKDEAIKTLLLVSERSRWLPDARTELTWMQSKDAGHLAPKWDNEPQS